MTRHRERYCDGCGDTAFSDTIKKVRNEPIWYCEECMEKYIEKLEKKVFSNN